jgi:Mg-chelatase subunit ChlD
MSPDQVKTIVRQATAAYGDGPMAVLPGQGGSPRANQREHTVFVVDVSGSMDSEYQGGMSKLEAAKRANLSMVLNKAQIDPNDEIGLVSFESHAHRILGLCPIHSHRAQIIQAVQSLMIGGGTDINEGLKAARKSFDWGRNDVVRRIMLLTDGQGGHPLTTAEDLKSRGVVIDVIGVGENPSGVDEKLLRKVASSIEGEVRYRFIKDQQTLVAHYTRLAGKTATGHTATLP